MTKWILVLILLIAGCSSDCERLEKEINQQIDSLDYCTVDQDCAFTSELGCPFGCYVFYNAKADITPIVMQVEEYRQQNCGLCVYSCIEAPGNDTIRCLNGKCEDTRIASD